MDDSYGRELSWVRRVLADEVQAAMDAGEPSLVFQPIVDLLDRRVVGVEALARFRSHQERSADIWFAAAHDAGLGVALEHRVVERAVAAAAVLPLGVYMAVNLSPASAVALDIDSLVSGDDATRLVVEITEHAPVVDYTKLRAALDRLRRRGARVAIDDVGAGFASLRHVLRLDPDIIKLDREITFGVEIDAGRAKLVGGLIAGASAVSTMVVAEGIESDEQLHRLLELGVRGGQGHHIARPSDLESALSTSVPLASVPVRPEHTSGSRPRPRLVGASVLIVDDATAHRQLLRSVLEVEGAIVHEAPTITAARRVLDDTSPDVVLLDVRLPDGTGYDVLDDVHAAPWHPLAIFVTGAAAVADRVRALDAGADDYILKPFSSEELVARLDACLRRPRRA